MVSDRIEVHALFRFKNDGVYSLPSLNLSGSIAVTILNRITMRKMKILVLLWSLALAVHAAPADTLKIYYRIDQKDLDSNKNKIDILLKNIDFAEDPIGVIGYTDFLGSNAYNQQLAWQRAMIVKAYLEQSNPNLKASASGKGEVLGLVTTGTQGDPLNRRVDIVYSKKIKVKEVKPVVNIMPVSKPPARITREPVIIEGSNLSAKERIDKLPALNVGEAISLDEITFKPGRHFLRSEAIPYLERILKVLKKNPNVKLDIQGHICCESDGRDGYDIDEGSINLSVNRARFIYEYFIREGISANRLSYIGLGSSKLKVFPEITSEDEVKNRRVVFMIVEN